MTGGPANPHLLDSFEHLLLCKSLCNDYTGYSYKYFLMYHISYIYISFSVIEIIFVAIWNDNKCTNVKTNVFPYRCSSFCINVTGNDSTLMITDLYFNYRRLH